jgi:hypothetical protein
MGDSGSLPQTLWHKPTGVPTQNSPHIEDDSTVEPIAIIGMACRLPGGADNPEKLWEILETGTSTWSPIPETRFNQAGFHHSAGDKAGTVRRLGSSHLQSYLG